MVSLRALRTSMLARVGESVNRTLTLPLVIVQPTSRCNSRCVSCDWWRSEGRDDLTVEEFGQLAGHLAHLDTRVALFSGGEPLLRPEIFAIAAPFRAAGISLHLLTSGVLLDRCADDVAALFDRVIISLDAATEADYRAIRGINALAVVERGVARLRRIAPGLSISARATLHRLNFRFLPALIEHARAMALDQVSFLTADVASLAFGRTRPLDRRAQAVLQLSADEVDEFAALVELTIARHGDDFATGFVAESADRLRRLPRYYAALLGDGPFPAVQCNAPWISVVVEADGTVRPCFFHAPIGNIRQEPFDTLIRERLPAFRGRLDVASNPVCQRCVCAINTGLRSAPWH